MSYWSASGRSARALDGPEMSHKATCYMCDLPEMSREHAPPSCFFPEQDTIGRDLRRNLVTVPSCANHNSKKSKDDEFLRAIILLVSAKHSDAAKHQFFQKLLVASRRKPQAHSNFVTNSGPAGDGDNVALRLDRKRFDACIDRLARALFVNEFRCKWQLPIFVASPNLYSKTDEGEFVAHQPTAQVVNVSQQYLGMTPLRGDNPEVFKYRARYDRDGQAFAFAGLFYDLFEVYTYSSAQAGHGAV